ncbi:hypothetical protein [Thiomicrorhabdus arctica]|uniref:hypothetical protein n=1 Tax=Thiomicrorhabdus arctica TaxID=131540 RepID=UPI0003737E98|nr:hypothetical protein [Thiomicrorhabdus arctica]
MRTKILAVSLFTFLIAGCAGNPNSSQAMQCENGLKVAYEELDFAKAHGFDGTVEYTKAASLLGAAKVQQQFDKYPNCIDKVERARTYIKASQH